MVVHSGHFTVVIAEGGTKALKRYKKLMLRRIDWTMKYQAAAVEGDEGGGEDEEDEEAEQARLNNKCVQVWEGTVSHGLQLQSLWTIPTAAVSYNTCSAGAGAQADFLQLQVRPWRPKR